MLVLLGHHGCQTLTSHPPGTQASFRGGVSMGLLFVGHEYVNFRTAPEGCAGDLLP